jgi:glutaredoxin
MLPTVAMPKLNVVLYTRRDCHLCDEALSLLHRYGYRPAVVDIDECEGHLARFNECVPVVEIDGRIRFRGRVSETLLRRLIMHGAR